MIFRRRTAQPPSRKPGSVNRNSSHAVVANRNRIYTLASQQHGLATWGQLRARGLAKATISRAVASERLIEVHEAVYSTIRPELMTVPAWHAAAVLKGGDGACLCHASGAWWTALVRDRPAEIHVAIGGTRQPIKGIRWHRLALRDDERIVHNRMPVMAPFRLPLDLATDFSVWELKRVLAELEYHYGIQARDVAVRKGYRGSAKLRQAIIEHTPQLARTRSELEQRYVFFCSEHGFLLPQFNHPLGTSTVDALYADQGVVVELDGVRGHSGERRILRDHRRDLHRRADGLLPLRYHYTQIVDPSDQLLVAADLDRAGIPRIR